MEKKQEGLFYNWSHKTDEERTSIINRLEQEGKTLDAMRAILKTGWKSQWTCAVKTIRNIGYPQNLSALPALVVDQHHTKKF